MAKDETTVVMGDAYIFAGKYRTKKGLAMKAIAQELLRGLGVTWSDIWVTRTHWPEMSCKIATPSPNPVVKYRGVDWGGDSSTKEECYDLSAEVAEDVRVLTLKAGVPDALREYLAPKS